VRNSQAPHRKKKGRGAANFEFHVDKLDDWLKENHLGPYLPTKVRAKKRAAAAAADAGPDGKYVDWKKRKDRADALKKETELEVLKGSLVSVEDVRVNNAKKAKVVKAVLYAMAGKLSGKLVGLREKEIYNILRKECDEALLQFVRAGEYESSDSA